MATRLERVVLELEDNFSSKMARAAASTALFDKTLAELDGHSTKVNRSTADLGGDNGGIAKTGRSARQAETDLNKYTGRLNLLLTTAATLGPALIPITAGAIPAVAGLTAGFGAAAGAAGVAMLAFNGVGDAVKAIDAYHLQPTTENLRKMNDALDALGPSGAQFAKFIDDLEPQLHDLQDIARQGLLPGVEQGISELLPLLPQVQQVVSGIAQEMGHLAAQAGDGLANDASFQRFFNYLQTDAAPTMDAFAKATGHVASGLASLTVDMAPLTRDFTGGLEHAAESFDRWAAGLGQTQGFHEFLAYVEQQGPKDIALLEALGEALLGILHAAAPVGAAVVPMLTALAKIIGAIGNSPLGPVFYTATVGMLAFNRIAAVSTSAIERLAAAWGMVGKAATTAATEQEVAAAAGSTAAAGGAGKGKMALVAGRILPAWVAGSLASGPINSRTHYGDTSLSDKNLKYVGSNLAFINPSIGGTGQGTVNKFMGAADFASGLIGIHGQRSGEKSSVAGIDQQLAAMVDSGQGAQAVASFATISASAKAAGASVSEVAKAFPAYTAAVKAAGGANQLLGTSADQARAELDKMVSAEEAQHQQALANFDAVTQWGQAVQNAAKQAASGAKGFNQYTAAGVANRQAVSQMIAAWNAQPKSIRNNVGQYEAAKAKLMQFAGQMGATKGQLAAFTKDMNRPRKFVIGAQTEEALSAIARVKAELSSIPRSVRTEYYVNQINAANKPKVLPGHSADGSTVPKTGLPYADRHLYLLADGEEVISNRNGQADRGRKAAKLINAGVLTDQMLGLAGGGTTGLTGPGSAFDYSIDTTQASSGSSKSSSAASKSAEAATKKLTKAQQEQAAAVAKATGELRHLKLDVSDLSGKQFKDLRSGLRDLLGKNLRLTGDSLKDLNKASKLLSRSLSDTESALSTARSNRDSLASTVSSGLMPDLFSTLGQPISGNPFSGQSAAVATPQSINAAIDKAKAQANEYGLLLQQVQAKGLHGDALNEVLSKGGIDALRMYANAPTSQVQQFQTGFTGLEKVVNTDASAAGQAIYGKQIAELTAIKKAMEHNTKTLKKAIEDKTKLDNASRAKHAKDTAAGVTAGVNGAAQKGHHNNPRKGGR